MEQAATANSQCEDQSRVFTVIVNGRPKEVSKSELSFDDIVVLAFGPDDAGPNICYTITFRRGQGNKPEGMLTEGDSLKIKEGIIFNVGRTDKS